MGLIQAGVYKFKDIISVENFASQSPLTFTFAPTFINGDIWTCGEFDTIGVTYNDGVPTGLLFRHSSLTPVPIYRNGVEYGSYVLYYVYSFAEGWRLKVVESFGEPQPLNISFGQTIIVTKDANMADDGEQWFRKNTNQFADEETKIKILDILTMVRKATKINHWTLRSGVETLIRMQTGEQGVQIVTTEQQMDEILSNSTQEANGTIYRYIGETTLKYTKNSYYKLEVLV